MAKDAINKDRTTKTRTNNNKKQKKHLLHRIWMSMYEIWKYSKKLIKNLQKQAEKEKISNRDATFAKNQMQRTI